ncbi:MAG: serine protease [Paenibacillus sp.]|nr:serine protease [Paenibacillus sp.]
MRKTGAVLSVMALFGFMLFITHNPRSTPGPHTENPGPAQEMNIKQLMLEQDIQLTDELCRSQCVLDFQDALHELDAGSASTVKSKLAALLQEHEHIQYAEWINGQQSLQTDKISEGTIPANVAQAAEPLLAAAKEQISQGQPYQSAPLGSGDNRYFVQGVPSENGQAALVGLIHQDLLRKVEVDLRKDLRMVPYPSDKRFKIESVDSDTLKDVKVDHPEDNEGTSHYHVNEVVVKFQSDPSPADLIRIQTEIGSESVRKLGNTYVFRSSNMEAKQLMDYFKNWSIEFVEPHFLYMTNEAVPAVEPNDVLFKKYQWNLPAIGTIPAWDINKGNQEIIVAVVDTGVDLTHSDLKNQLLPGYNVVNEGREPADDVGHGTHVAGVISALVNNREGVAGMTWFNKILPIKVLDETGAGSTYSVAQGIIWATDQGAKVINMSLGNYAEAKFLHDAIKYAYDRDVVLIAASGNDNTERPGYPAAYPEVFAVAATDSSKQKASFSNYGDYIDVAAPGVNIASTYPHNQYAALSGTSMASPHVTALAALIRSVNPLLKNTEVMDIMRKTATDFGTQGKDKYFGYGQIDVNRALEMANQNSHSLSSQSNWIDRQLQKIAEKYKNLQ